MSAEIFAKSINHNPKLGPDLEMVSETMVSETAQWNRNSILPGVPSGTLTRTCLSTNEKFGAVWLLKRSKTINYPSRIETFQNGNGHKLVAAQDLPAGTVVEKFEGPVVDYENCADYDKRYVLVHHRDGDPEDTWRYLLPLTPARYLNHSCEPTCIITDTLDVVTVVPVREGEDLTFIYNKGTEDDPWDDVWSFECRCGALNCQGKIDRYRDVAMPVDPNGRVGKTTTESKFK